MSPKIYSENEELNRTKTEHDQIQQKYNELQVAHDLVLQKNMNFEKYKVELVETRNAFDEQRREMDDLHQQLKECREEINFLCTTNENLTSLNETLTQKIKKYPQYDTLYNSVLQSPIATKPKSDNNSVDDLTEIAEDNVDSLDTHEIADNLPNEQNQPNEPNDAKAANTAQQPPHDFMDRMKSVSVSDNMSLVNLDCPKLDRCHSTFVVENTADEKIKEELQRITADKTRWNQEYQQLMAEKQGYIQSIAHYQETIQKLATELDKAV